MQPKMNTDQNEINTVGSVDILKERQRCLKRYRLKLSPRSRVWRICLRSDRPGARAESLRFSEEKGSRATRPLERLCEFACGLRSRFSGNSHRVGLGRR